MKKTTKLILILAVVTLLGALLALSSFAEIYTGDCGADGNNLTYTFDSETGVLFITGTGNMQNYNSSNALSSTEDDEGWTPIWRPGTSTNTVVYPWTAFRDEIEVVIIDDMVANIGNDAFYNCSSLTSVTIGNSVTSIGSSAFSDCRSLKNLYITDLESWLNVKLGSFSSHPLYSASGNLYIEGKLVTNIAIPDNVTEIGYSVFVGCSGLTSVTIPDSVTSIGGYAFGRCDSLTSIKIPNCVTSIEEYAFSGCSGLTSVTIETKNATFGFDVFGSCNNLEDIYLYLNSTADNYFSSSYYNKKYLDICSIVYDIDGGIGEFEEQTKIGYETITLSDVIPTKHGYNFGGWRGSDGMTYSAGGACSVNTDIVLTAIWNPMAVTLIYDANGGNVSPSSKTVYYEESYGTLANPTRVGYTFAGWYTEKDGGSRVSSSTYVNTIENITIFAHWSANSYSVSFDANGGTISDGSKRVVFDSEYGTLPTPVLAGFTFDGWYTAIEGGARITDTTIVKNAADHTLYAHWKGASYLLILDANGGKCTPDSKNVDFGEKYGELPVPTRAGYKFITWSKTKSESGAVNADTVHNSTSDVTLYAVWLKLGDPNGDDIIDTKDAVLLAQFLAKWAVEIDPISADCNGDGVLDTKDAVLLAQYLAKWDVTLGK